MGYLTLKWIHIISSTILFGTGIGSAFYMFIANMYGDVKEKYFVIRYVVIADWIFTTPAVVIQLVSGLALMDMGGYSFSDTWILWGVSLYIFAGICWLPVVWIQVKMRDMLKAALENNQPLPDTYRSLHRWWVTLGCLAFPAVVIIFYVMVFKLL